MRLLFLFVDGLGLGEDNPQHNPLAAADMPVLQGLLAGQRLLASSAPYHGEHASLVALDACLGVEGQPQSATGQAALLSGQNVPAAIGRHYGPKPNPEVARFLEGGAIFTQLLQAGRSAALLNAYPDGYFKGIASGRRLYSAIPLAVTNAGISLKDADDLHAGRAISADFTGRGWREHLGLADTPLLSPVEAGQRLATLAETLDLAFFEFWLSDYAGHRQSMPAALALLETFDQVLAGLVKAWDAARGLVLLTSDHGNLEDLSTRRHTLNPVPALVIGDPERRKDFVSSLADLSDIAPAITRLLI